MTVNAATGASPVTQDQKPAAKFDQALDKAQGQLIDPGQLAEMGMTVMWPLLTSQLQDIIGDALAEDD